MRACALVFEGQLALNGTANQWHDGQHAHAFAIQGADESLDHGDAALLPDGTLALPDVASTTPAFEGMAAELRAGIGEPRKGWRRRFHQPRSFQKRLFSMSWMRSCAAWCCCCDSSSCSRSWWVCVRRLSLSVTNCCW